MAESKKYVWVDITPTDVVVTEEMRRKKSACLARVYLYLLEVQKMRYTTSVLQEEEYQLVDV